MNKSTNWSLNTSRNSSISTNDFNIKAASKLLSRHLNFRKRLDSENLQQDYDSK